MAIYDNIKALRASLPDGVKLVAVSKYHPFERIVEAYEAGQRSPTLKKLVALAAAFDISIDEYVGFLPMKAKSS